MRARAGGRVGHPAERVIDYMTALARDQEVHVVTLDAIIGACEIRPLKWPDLFEKHLTDMVEAVPGRDAYRLRKKRSDLMARLTDEERVVGHLLEVGVASPADIRRALSLAESDTKDILHRLAVDGRAQYEGRGRGVRWSLVETRPVPPPVEASPVVEERAVPAPTAVEEPWPTDAEMVATEHEFRAIAKAMGLGPSSTAGEIADAVRAVGAERDEAREEAAGWRARAERALAEGQAAAAQLEGKRLEVLDRSRAHADLVEAVTRALGGDTDEPISDEALVHLAKMAWESLTSAQKSIQGNRDFAAQANARRDEAVAEVKRIEVALDQLCDKLEATEAVLEVVYKALGLTKEAATDEAITKAIAGLVASPSPDGRIPYEVLEGRLAFYRGAWCDLAGAVTGTPTDPAGEHGELEVGGVLAMATRLRADADAAADLPAIIDRLAKERDEARARVCALERRAEATNVALCDLRRKARRKLDRARDRLADAENGLNTIELVPLASDDIPF